MLNHFRFISSGCSLVAIALLILPHNCSNYFHLLPEICNSNKQPYIVRKCNLSSFENPTFGEQFAEFLAANLQSPNFRFEPNLNKDQRPGGPWSNLPYLDPLEDFLSSSIKCGWDLTLTLVQQSPRCFVKPNQII